MIKPPIVYYPNRSSHLHFNKLFFHFPKHWMVIFQFTFVSGQRVFLQKQEEQKIVFQCFLIGRKAPAVSLPEFRIQISHEATLLLLCIWFRNKEQAVFGCSHVASTTTAQVINTLHDKGSFFHIFIFIYLSKLEIISPLGLKMKKKKNLRGEQKTELLFRSNKKVK